MSAIRLLTLLALSLALDVAMVAAVSVLLGGCGALGNGQRVEWPEATVWCVVALMFGAPAVLRELREWRRRK